MDKLHSSPLGTSPEDSPRLIIASLFLPTTIVLDQRHRKPTTTIVHEGESAIPPATSVPGSLSDDSPFTPMTDPSRPYRKPSRNTANHHHPSMKSSHHPNNASFLSSGSRAMMEEWVDNWHVEKSPAGNIGLQNAVHSVADTIKERVWIGLFSGIATNQWSDVFKSNIEEKMKNVHGEVHCPVWVSPQELEGHYDHFCKQILWKPFHYELRDYIKGQAFEEKSWQSYVAVNQKFADAIVKNYRDGDVIWVNDYHLLLVPLMVRNAVPGATIGFFLHIPFPSSEIFRCFHVRKEILQGILGADLVGFQTYSFLRHFLMTCTRLLSVESTPNGIELENRVVSVGIFPIGINLLALNEKRHNPEVPEMIAALREKYAGKKILIGRDKHDFIKGVRHKMLSFERFLSTHPEWQGRVVLIQVALSTTEKNEAENQVLDVVSRINSRFGTIAYTPVVYLQQNISFSHYLALLTLADACIITSLRDGMNLTSHEYVACQEGHWGPLIISEFAGTYGSFGAALRVNPWDRGEVSEAILEALTMSEEDKKYRWKELYAFVSANNAQNFVLNWVSKLSLVHKENAYKMSSRIPRIPVERVLRAFSSSARCIFFVDDRDTLFMSSGTSSLSASAAAEEKSLASHIKLITQLASNPNHLVYIMSDAPRTLLTEYCGISNVGVCAENGCFLKYANRTKWETMLPDQESDFSVWQKKVLEVFEFYTDRTPGSYIEEKDVSIVWHYLPDHFASVQAAECQNHIQNALGPAYPIHTMMTKKTIEVMPRNVNKGLILRRVLEHHQGRLRTRTQTQTQTPKFIAHSPSLLSVSSQSHEDRLGVSPDRFLEMPRASLSADGLHVPKCFFDFIFCVGNGRSDEYMFEYLQHLDSTPLPIVDASNLLTPKLSTTPPVDSSVTKLVKELTIASSAFSAPSSYKKSSSLTTSLSKNAGGNGLHYNSGGIGNGDDTLQQLAEQSSSVDYPEDRDCDTERRNGNVTPQPSYSFSQEKLRSKSVPILAPVAHKECALLDKPGRAHVVTCTVGARSSAAQWYASSVAEVCAILADFADLKPVL